MGGGRFLWYAFLMVSSYSSSFTCGAGGSPGLQPCGRGENAYDEPERLRDGKCSWLHRHPWLPTGEWGCPSAYCCESFLGLGFHVILWRVSLFGARRTSGSVPCNPVTLVCVQTVYTSISSQVAQWDHLCHRSIIKIIAIILPKEVGMVPGIMLCRNSVYIFIISISNNKGLFIEYDILI